MAEGENGNGTNYGLAGDTRPRRPGRQRVWRPEPYLALASTLVQCVVVLIVTAGFIGAEVLGRPFRFRDMGVVFLGMFLMQSWEAVSASHAELIEAGVTPPRLPRWRAWLLLLCAVCAVASVAVNFF